ncbi:MAG: clpP [Clostridiaceae bacterium]|jgi:ATP-dependent Clp protease protease subunit|nr:clpP [Clostridiaceae bacterium]
MNYDDCIKKSIEYIEHNLNNKIYSEKTGQPIEKIEKDMERDFFMSAEEALSYGIIDKVLCR